MKPPRYSLRTLFVAVTLFCLWLGWQVHCVQVRKDWLMRVQAAGGRVYFGDTFREKYPTLTQQAPQEVSWYRRLLGDRSVHTLFVIVNDPKDKQRAAAEVAPIKSAFPEATVLPSISTRKGP